MKNGCFDKPRPVAGARLQVQDGWHESHLSNTRYPRMVTVPFVLSTDCQYTLTTPDPRCAGCVHERKGD